MSKRNLFVLIPLLIFISFSFSQKSKDVKVKQFDYCYSIDGINFDSIRIKGQMNQNSISLIILRAESTHSDGSKTITPLDSFIILYDTSLINIFSYELKYTKGSSSCEFKFSAGDKSSNVTKGNPPFLCITSQNDSLLRYLKKIFNLSYYNQNEKFLLLSQSYNSDKGFYKQLNKILYYYDQTFINTFEITGLRKPPITTNKSSHTLSILYSPSLINQVLESGIKPGSIYMTNNKLNSLQFNFEHYLKNISGLGLTFGASYSKFRADLGVNRASIVDTLNRQAIDKDGEKYTRIAYGYGLEELIKINYMGLSAGLCYKMPCNAGNNRMNVTFSSGIVVSNILSSSYRATAGTLSWSGYYPQYDSSNTIFGENYGFYKNQAVYNESKHLELKSMFLSGFASVDWEAGIGTSNCFFKTSLYMQSGSNILNINPKDRQMSYTSGDYNSLAYRNDKLKINSWGLKFGFSYTF